MYIRLYLTEEVVSLFFGKGKWDVSRELRRLLPLLIEVLPSPDILEPIEEMKGRKKRIGKIEELKEFFPELIAILDTIEQKIQKSKG